MCFHQSDGIVKIEAVNVFFRQQCSQQIVLGAVEAGVDAPLRSSHGSATATCGQKHFATCSFSNLPSSSTFQTFLLFRDVKTC